MIDYAVTLYIYSQFDGRIQRTGGVSGNAGQEVTISQELCYQQGTPSVEFGVVATVCSLNVESEELVTYRSELVRQIQAHKKYHQYMSRVLEVAGDFHEISEIMSRYQTLLATHEVLDWFDSPTPSITVALRLVTLQKVVKKILATKLVALQRNRSVVCVCVCVHADNRPNF